MENKKFRLEMFRLFCWINFVLVLDAMIVGRIEMTWTKIVLVVVLLIVAVVASFEESRPENPAK